MSNEKNVKSRIQHKHDIEANWLKATNFIPKAGEFIIYDIDDNYKYPRLKIGDGVQTVIDLPFSAGIQSDHIQNDPAAPDYIKNRLGWIEDRVVLDETIHMNPTNEFGGACTGHSSTLFEIKENTTYIVTINDKTYSCKSKSMIESNINIFYIGDYSQTNEEEPFIIYSHSDAGGTNILFFAPLSEAEDWNITIKAYDGEAHKIDLRLLPEGVGYSDSESRILIPMQSFTFINGIFSTELSSNAPICEEGKEYIVTWENEPYTVLCKKIKYEGLDCLIGGNLSLLFPGQENSQEPFLFACLPEINTLIVATNYEDGTYNLELKENPIHKIDSKYYEQLCDIEYLAPIVIEDKSNLKQLPSLIGSKVNVHCDNRYQLPIILGIEAPEQEKVLYSSSTLNIGYGGVSEGMTNIPVLICQGSTISLLAGDDFYNNSYTFFLVYIYENTVLNPLNKTFQPGWYFCRIDLENEIFLVESYNMQKNPVYFYIQDKYQVNASLTENLLLNVPDLEYTITENNIYTQSDDQFFIGNNFNNKILATLESAMAKKDAWSIYALGDILVSTSPLSITSLAMFKQGIMGADSSYKITFTPVKKLKKIESQYIPYIQPNWTQNDPTKSDYIKNRPGGWSEYESNEILNVPSDDFSSQEGGGYVVESSFDISLKKDGLYEVSWDLSSYYIVCKQQDNNLYIGQYHLYDSNAPILSDEEKYPFVIISNETQPCWIYSSAPYLISVRSIDEIIHEIPEKYIPIIDFNDYQDTDGKTLNVHLNELISESFTNIIIREKVEWVGREIQLNSSEFKQKIINDKIKNFSCAPLGGKTTLSGNICSFEEGFTISCNFITYIPEMNVAIKATFFIMSMGDNNITMQVFLTPLEEEWNRAQLTKEQLTELTALMEGV